MFPVPAFLGAVVLFVVVRTIAVPDAASDAEALTNDFKAFYTAGQMILQGRAESLYDLAAQEEVQVAIPGVSARSDVMGFFYPPPIAALAAAVAWLPPERAHQMWSLAWDGAWLLCLGWSLHLAPRSSPKVAFLTQTVLGIGFAAFPPVILARVSGQPVPLVLLALLAAFTGVRRMDSLRAGFAWLTAGVKPHFFFLGALATATSAGRRVLFGSLAAMIVWVLFSIVIAGPGVLISFPRLLASLAASGSGHGVTLEHTISVRGVVFQLLGQAPLGAWLLPAILIGAACLWLIRTAGPAAWPIFLLAAPPHALYHDAALLLFVPVAAGVHSLRGLAVSVAVLVLHWIGVVHPDAWPLLAFGSLAVVGGALSVTRPGPHGSH